MPLDLGGLEASWRATSSPKRLTFSIAKASTPSAWRKSPRRPGSRRSASIGISPPRTTLLSPTSKTAWPRVPGANGTRRSIDIAMIRAPSFAPSWPNSARAGRLEDGYRGCPFINFCAEFPDPSHPGRRVAQATKQALRERFVRLAEALQAPQPQHLADSFLLLVEGAYGIRQTRGGGPEGVGRSVVWAGEMLVTAQPTAAKPKPPKHVS